MENIYKIGERFIQIDADYEAAMAALDAKYEENEGEITDETEALEKQAKELRALREQIAGDILSAPDEYAAIVMNANANKKILEAELKALKEEQAKACAKIEARIKRMNSKIDWFKTQIEDAMKFADIKKIGGVKTGNKFTIWFKETESVEADSEIVMKPYEALVRELINSLPNWITVKTDINKNALKANLKDENAVHPDGAVINTNKTLQIK